MQLHFASRGVPASLDHIFRCCRLANESGDLVCWVPWLTTTGIRPVQMRWTPYTRQMFLAMALHKYPDSYIGLLPTELILLMFPFLKNVAIPLWNSNRKKPNDEFCSGFFASHAERYIPEVQAPDPCAVCFERMGNSQLLITKCRHGTMICTVCLEDWRLECVAKMKKFTCPLCRSTIN